MKVTVIVFPGTNCDHDAEYGYERLLGQKVSSIWHRETKLPPSDILVLPGGFAFGDYLRTGALAKISPIIPEVIKFANKGGPVLGICNGFQMLCEVGLLPGALLQNASMKFLSQFVHIRVDENRTPFTKRFNKGDRFTCPIAHFEGNYFADSETIDQLEAEGQVVFRYVGAHAEYDPQNKEYNPNGSLNSIAGVCNSARNVVGLMPHPERAAEALVGFIGRDSGLGVLASSVER